MTYLRQCAAAILLLAGACSATERPAEDSPLPFHGGVAADEPQAALVAREILEKGGSAADAAVALYFALAVTKPSAASLGAGGACLAYDPAWKTVQAIGFAPEPGASGVTDTVAPPTAVRGMAALHGRFGRLRWEQLVAAAEALARFGVPVSRSFAADLAAAAPEIEGDPSGRGIFTGADGRVVGEGDIVRQPDLADILSAIRAQGPGAFYSEALGQRYVQGVKAAGGDLTLTDVQDSAVQVREPFVLRSGSRRVHFAPYPGTMGPYQARLWTLLTDHDRFVRTREAERPRLVAEAASHARAGQSTGTTDPSGTSFVVADAHGGAVACGITMGRPFGLGRIAAGTGIFPAVRPAAGAEVAALSPVLVMNPNTQILLLAAAGSGQGAPTAVTQLALRTLEGGESLAEAMSAPRADSDGPAGQTLAASPIAERLSGMGQVDAPGRLNAVFCSQGLPDNSESCDVRTDRHGAGLAVKVRK